MQNFTHKSKQVRHFLKDFYSTGYPILKGNTLYDIEVTQNADGSQNEHEVILASLVYDGYFFWYVPKHGESQWTDFKNLQELEKFLQKQ